MALRRGPQEPSGGEADRSIVAPTIIYIVLGVLVVGAFILALVFVFHAPPSWKADHTLGPVQSPAPPQQVAPSAPTPRADPSNVG